jgi:hypothetical protein
MGIGAERVGLPPLGGAQLVREALRQALGRSGRALRAGSESRARHWVAAGARFAPVQSRAPGIGPQRVRASRRFSVARQALGRSGCALRADSASRARRWAAAGARFAPIQRRARHWAAPGAGRGRLVRRSMPRRVLPQLPPRAFDLCLSLSDFTTVVQLVNGTGLVR